MWNDINIDDTLALPSGTEAPHAPLKPFLGHASHRGAGGAPGPNTPSCVACLCQPHGICSAQGGPNLPALMPSDGNKGYRCLRFPRRHPQVMSDKLWVGERVPLRLP